MCARGGGDDDDDDAALCGDFSVLLSAPQIHCVLSHNSRTVSGVGVSGVRGEDRDGRTRKRRDDEIEI